MLSLFKYAITLSLLVVVGHFAISASDTTSKELASSRGELIGGGANNQAILDSFPIKEKSPKSQKPLLIAEQMPQFPGGQAEMMQYIKKNLIYPSMARENNIQGTVAVRFVVDKDGSIDNVEVVRGIGGGCDQEAARLIKSMPTWKPGKQNGKVVKVYFTLPVKFKIDTVVKTK